MADNLRVIDSHLHFCKLEGFDTIAVEAGYENTEPSLHRAFEANGIVHGIVMSNRSLNPADHVYPEYLSYCIGLDSMMANQNIQEALPLLEANLQRRSCCGIKLYPGYNHRYIYDAAYRPVYELAEKYAVPVAIHTGLTATANALLKYSHPFTLDEAAVMYPDVQFVMCHFGNPFLQDAIAVLEKNRNVAVDLSGLLEGKIDDVPAFMEEKKGYFSMLRDWLSYLGCYDRVMFGTDWPLANFTDYIDIVKSIIPERYWDDVFFNTANRIYKLGLPEAGYAEGDTSVRRKIK